MEHGISRTRLGVLAVLKFDCRDSSVAVSRIEVKGRADLMLEKT